jgi:hypothetical protein
VKHLTEKGIKTLDELKKESAETADKAKEFLIGEIPKHGDLGVIHALIDRLELIHDSVEKAETNDIDFVNLMLTALENEWSVKREDLDDRLLVEIGFLERVTKPTVGNVRAFKLSRWFENEYYPESKACLREMFEFEKTLPKTLAASSLFTAYSYFLIWSHKNVWLKVSTEKQAMVKYLMYNLFEDFKQTGQ